MRTDQITARQRIENVARRTNNNSLLNQQISQRYIWDSIDVSTLQTATAFSFFQSTQNKTLPFTNWQQQFTNGECMAVEHISFYIALADGAATPRITGIVPLEADVQGQALISNGYFDMTLASSQVIKQIPLSGQYAPTNPTAKFVSAYGTGTGNNTPVIYGDSVIEIDSAPIILPNFTLQLNFTTQGVGTFATPKTKYLFCRLGGFGTVAAPVKY